MMRVWSIVALVGCFSGSALAWAPIDPEQPVWRRTLEFALNENGSDDLSFAETEREVVRAFEAWSAATCTGLEIAYLGQTDLDAREYAQVVSWTEQDWALGPETIGATLSTYSLGNTPTIEWSTMQLNGQDYRWTLTQPRRIFDVDVFTVVLHEAGHYLGLDHSDEEGAVMTASYAGPTAGLSEDDILGVCSLYPEGTPGLAGAVAATAGDCAAPAPTWDDRPDVAPDAVPGPRVPDADTPACDDADCALEEAPACSANAQCDARSLCLDGACVPAAEVVGGRCTFDDECATGLCQSQASAALCTAACDADLDCPEGFLCDGTADFTTCRPIPTDDPSDVDAADPPLEDAAEAGAGPDASSDGGGGCRAAPTTQTSGAWLALPALALFVATRRTTRGARR